MYHNSFRKELNFGLIWRKISVEDELNEMFVWHVKIKKIHNFNDVIVSILRYTFDMIVLLLVLVRSEDYNVFLANLKTKQGLGQLTPLQLA